VRVVKTENEAVLGVKTWIFISSSLSFSVQVIEKVTVISPSIAPFELVENVL